MSYMCNITSFDLIERKFIFSSTTSMKKTKTTATQTTTWTLLQPLCHHGSLTANRLDDNATGYPPPPPLLGSISTDGGRYHLSSSMKAWTQMR